MTKAVKRSVRPKRGEPDRGPRFQRWRAIYSDKLRAWQARPRPDDGTLLSHAAAMAVSAEVAKFYHLAFKCVPKKAKEKRKRVCAGFVDLDEWITLNTAPHPGRRKGSVADIAGEAVLCLVHQLNFSQRAANKEVRALGTECGVDLKPDQVRKAVARWKSYVRKLQTSARKMRFFTKRMRASPAKRKQAKLSAGFISLPVL